MPPKRKPGVQTRSSAPAEDISAEDLTPKNSTVKRPAIPVKQSFAYGSPARVTLPRKIDKNLRNKSVAQALDEALAQSKAATLPKTNSPQKEEHEELEETEEPEEPEDAEEPEELEVSDESVQSEHSQEETDEESDRSESNTSDQLEESEIEFKKPPIPLRPRRATSSRRSSSRQDDDNTSVISFNTELHLGNRARIRPGRPPAPARLPTRQSPRANGRGNPTTSTSSFQSTTQTFGFQTSDTSSSLEGNRSFWQNYLRLPKVDYDYLLRGLAVCVLLWSFILFFISTSRSWNPMRPSHPLMGPPGESPVGSYVGASQFNSMVKNYEHQIQSLQKSLQDRMAIMESSVKDLANIAQARVSIAIPSHRINFFAKGAGALIDPYLTSPTRERVDNRYPWHSNSILNLLLGPPMRNGPGPDAVLQSWDDVGDCWCSPDWAGKSQVAVNLDKLVYPESIFVEHIDRGASLNPGAAPRNFEMWVQILDPRKRENVANAALSRVPDYHSYDELLGDDEDKISPETEPVVYHTRRSLDDTWVRIGKWQYDGPRGGNIQGFEIQDILQQYEAPVNRVVVRVLDSWGEKFVCIYRLRLYGQLVEIKGAGNGNTN